MVSLFDYKCKYIGTDISYYAQTEIGETKIMRQQNIEQITSNASTNS